MLAIDCLLKDTELIDDIKQYVRKLGTGLAMDEKDASFGSVYRTMRRKGIEVDIDTAAKIYEETLPVSEHSGFTSPEDLQRLSGREFDNTVRNHILQKGKDGHDQIGNLPNGKAIAKKLIGLFNSRTIEDSRTKSVLKQMHDIVFDVAKSQTGELPEKGKSTKDTRSFEEVAADAIDRQKTLGYENIQDGGVNDMATSLKNVQELMKGVTDKMESESNDPIVTEQWRKYAKDLQDAMVSVIMTKEERQAVVEGALKEQGFVKEGKNGPVVDYEKLSGGINSIQDLHENVMDALVKKGFDRNTARMVADSMQKEYVDIKAKTMERAANKLQQAEKALDRDAPEQKSQMRRLAELSGYGLFDSTHEKLIDNLTGIDPSNVADLHTIKDILQRSNDLKSELGNKKFLDSYPYKVFQRQIEHILDKNKNDKSKMLKIARIISEYQGYLNMGIIANPYNLVENNLSGMQALMAVNENVLKQMGKEGMFGDHALWKATWKDVALGGVEHGEAGEKWRHIGSADKLNSLNFKADPKKALGTLAMYIPRGFLNGSDAAYKAVIHKKGMMLALHNALTHLPEKPMTKEEATHFLNEALYGQKFEQAKAQAGKLLEKYGLANDENTRTRFANDLVMGNLGLDHRVTEDMIEAAHNSGFHAAAVALGHEANNPLSESLHASKVAALQKENRMIERGEYGKAALLRLRNTLWYNGVWRFASGAANWGVLRLESSGLGLVRSYLGREQTGLDFSSKEKLQQAMENRLVSDRQATRAITGMSMAALTFGLLAAYGSQRNKEDEDTDESNLESGVKGAKSNYVTNRLMNKVAPDLALMYYLAKTSKGEGDGAAIDGGLKYLANTFNLDNDFSPSGKIIKAGKEAVKGGQGIDKAMGDLGSIAGDMYGTPFYKPAKDFYKLIDYAATGKKVEYKYIKPMGVMQGMVGGGMIQDLAGELPIEALEKAGLENWKTDADNW